jgi:hypothetical protein
MLPHCPQEGEGSDVPPLDVGHASTQQSIAYSSWCAACREAWRGLCCSCASTRKGWLSHESCEIRADKASQAATATACSSSGVDSSPNKAAVLTRSCSKSSTPSPGPPPLTASSLALTIPHAYMCYSTSLRRFPLPGMCARSLVGND